MKKYFICSCLFSFVAFSLISCAKNPGLTKAEKRPVADFNKREEIWRIVAGNSERSKLSDMNINYEKKNVLIATLNFIKAIRGQEYKDKEQDIDNFTYLRQIKGGYDQQNYTDQPYIIPYLVDGSDKAVIIVPGGGYGYKEINGGSGEGKDIALKINEMGISSFVLNYRSNPYEYPIPMLDLQRAVRYLKFDAAKFGINPKKISVIGFSAGGNLVATYINLIQGKNYFPVGYQMDEIDYISDQVVSAAMVYPALTYEFNVNMLFNMFDSKLVKNDQEREKLLQLTDLSTQITSASVPQFVSYSKADKMVDYRGTERYILSAKSKAVKISVAEVKKQDHGFNPKFYWTEYQSFINHFSQ